MKDYRTMEGLLTDHTLEKITTIIDVDLNVSLIDLISQRNYINDTKELLKNL